MKGFIAATVILCLLLGGVIFNAFFVDQQTDRLLDLLDSIPKIPSADGAVELCDTFRERWSDFSVWLLLTVDHKAVEDIEDTAATLSSYARTGDIASYAAALSLLREELIHLRKAELFSFGGIF